MSYLIGMDEAGYGPNLGPLVVSATCWYVPEAGAEMTDLYERLSQVVTRKPKRGDDRIAIADSKALYKSGQGMARLEAAVLAASTLCHGPIADATQLWDRLAADRANQRQQLPWHEGFRIALPVSAAADRIDRLVERLRAGLRAADVRLEGVESRAVFPAQFNRLIVRYGTKSDALSHLSLELLADLLAPIDSAPVCAISDKHGGRNRYAHLLEEHFPTACIRTEREGRQESLYRWGPDRKGVAVRFAAGGEAHLPVALASMTAKYLRELAMRAENDFWCSRVAGLKPTAGYPVDAKRFKAQIDACQRELAIDDRLLWRTR
ncbi:MAG: hypothetical protein ACC645_12995 [Pirellulales bacterium]